MKPWTFKNSAPWRGVFDIILPINADFRRYSHELGFWAGNGFPYNLGTVTGGYWQIIQAGGGEGGTTDVLHWNPVEWHPDPAAPATRWRSFIKGWISPDDGTPDTPNLDRQPSSAATIVFNLSMLPDGGKYALGWWPVFDDAGRSRLYYPDLLRNDPNYGTITLGANVKEPFASEAKTDAMVQMAIKSIAAAGFAALEFPALAMSSVKSLQNPSVSGAIGTLFSAGLAMGDEFDVSDILDNTDTVDDFLNNAPGFDDGAFDPDVDDFSNPYDQELYDNLDDPGEGMLDDAPDPEDDGTNDINPDSEPGMPNAPIGAARGLNKDGTRRGTAPRKKSTRKAAAPSSFFDSLFGTNYNHKAPGYPAGRGSLFNQKPVSQTHPFGNTSGSVRDAKSGLAIFTSPAMIAVMVAGGIALVMTR